MAGKRLALVHNVAENRGPESGAPTLDRAGFAVSGFATFYIPQNQIVKIKPGRLDLSELWGGASGVGNGQVFGLLGSSLVRTGVEFYLPSEPTIRNRAFVTVDGRVADVFTFGFFGRRFS